MFASSFHLLPGRHDRSPTLPILSPTPPPPPSSPHPLLTPTFHSGIRDGGGSGDSLLARSVNHSSTARGKRAPPEIPGIVLFIACYTVAKHRLCVCVCVCVCVRERERERESDGMFTFRLISMRVRSVVFWKCVHPADDRTERKRERERERRGREREKERERERRKKKLKRNEVGMGQNLEESGNGGWPADSTLRKS